MQTGKPVNTRIFRLKTLDCPFTSHPAYPNHTTPLTVTTGRP
jgi:hypothetical protein